MAEPLVTSGDMFAAGLNDQFVADRAAAALLRLEAWDGYIEDIDARDPELRAAAARLLSRLMRQAFTQEAHDQQTPLSSDDELMITELLRRAQLPAGEQAESVQLQVTDDAYARIMRYEAFRGPAVAKKNEIRSDYSDHAYQLVLLSWEDDMRTRGFTVLEEIDTDLNQKSVTLSGPDGAFVSRMTTPCEVPHG